MCMSKCCGKEGCVVARTARVLLLVGGLNWGLVGVGMLMDSNLNVVNMILGSMSVLEGIVYVLVGVAALMSIFGCKCSKCKEACDSCSNGVCSVHGSSDNKMGGSQ